VTALVLMLLAAPPFDPETPNPFLVEARDLYEQLDFEKCLVRVRQASQWKNSSTQDLRDVEIVGGLCALNIGARTEASERFRQALRIDPNVELPEFASPKAVKLFTFVKRSMRGPIPPMPDEDLPPDAKPDRPLEVTTPSRFPIKPLPLIFAGGSLLALIVGVALGVHAKDLEAQARAQPFEADYLAVRSQAFGSATAANFTYVLSGVALLTGILLFLVQRPD
jgi:hypothetical protein